MTTFHPLVPGPHVQTIGGQFLRSFLRWPFTTEDQVIASTDGVEILVRASWQREASRPAIVLIHGLEGSDRSRYLISTGIVAYRAGYHVIRMNMRGCGDSLALCPRLYNAGLTEDVVAVARWLDERVSRFAIVGFSLGAGLTLLTFARNGDCLPKKCVGAVAVCPPLDMSACADALEKRHNWLYQRQFTASLCRSYRKRQARAPERYERGREHGVRTLREFDDEVTARYGGYRDAEDYYRTVSTGPKLQAIERSTLVLAADNDPFIPIESVRHWSHSEHVRVEIAEGAGHVGFIASCDAPRMFWAAERTIAFTRAIDPL